MSEDALARFATVGREALTFFSIATEYANDGDFEELQGALAARPAVREALRVALAALPHGDPSAAAARVALGVQIRAAEARLVAAVEARTSKIREELGGLRKRKRCVGKYEAG